MKRIFRVLISVLMIVVLAVTACKAKGEGAVKESESQTAQTTQKETESTEAKSISDEEFSIGEINDSVYTNKIFGIKFDAKANGMILADDKMLSKINQGITDRTDVEAIKEKIKKDNVFLDMFAYNGDYKETIGVSILDASGLKDEQDYFNITLSKYENDEKVKAEKNKGNFLGKEVNCLLFEEEIEGKKQYQKHVIIKKGNYMANIIAKGGDPETVQSELDMFTAFEDIPQTEKSSEEPSEGESLDPNTSKEENNGEGTLKEGENTDKKENAAGEDTEFSTGEIRDGVYVNKMFGVKFDGGANSMEFTGRQELNPEFYTDGNLNMEAVITGLENGNKFIDMSANGPQNGCYVTIEKTALKDIDSYMDSAISGLKAGYEEEGFNVNIEKSAVKFTGEDMPCISIEASFEGSTIYQKLVFLKSEDYIYSVASFGENEAFATAGLGMFTKLGD